jgi:hypothetical protein
MPITKGTPMALILTILILLFTVGVIAMAGAAVADVTKNIHSPNPLGAVKAVLDTIYGQFAAVWNGLVALWAWVTRSHVAEASRMAMPNTKAHGFWWQYLLALVAWGVLIGLVFVIRYFLINYVGAVAAYLAPYKDSKFEDLRGSIQAVGLDAARLVSRTLTTFDTPGSCIVTP